MLAELLGVHWCRQGGFLLVSRSIENFALFSRARTKLSTAVLCSVLCFVGCRGFGGGQTKSAFDRDPLVMAHLTHSKDDPAYRDTDTDLGRFDEPQLQPASATQTRSNKPSERASEKGSEILAADYGAPIRSRAPDYSWLRGAVRYSRAEIGAAAGSNAANGAWYIEYGRSAKDRFGGRLRLAPAARLGLFREGDPVHLSGKINASDPLDPVYEVADIVLLR